MEVLKERKDGVNFRIEGIVAFVAIDPDDKEEGVIGVTINGMHLPAIAADLERVKMLAPIIEEHCSLHGIEYRIVRFSLREDITNIVKSIYL